MSEPMGIEEMKRRISMVRNFSFPTVVLPAGTGLVADFTFPARIVESPFVEPGTAYVIASELFDG